MNIRVPLKYIILSLFTIQHIGVQAKEKKPHIKIPTPHAILVQLSTYQHKIDHFKKYGKYKNAEDIKKEAAIVTTYLKKDYKDHFNFCKVFYFSEDNIEAIKNRQFTGVLMNADGSLATATDIANTIHDSDYVIACMTFDTKPTFDDPTLLISKGLLLLNYQYKQIYLFAESEIVFTIKEIFVLGYKKYIYDKSKYPGVDYFPYAKDLNNFLKDDWRKKQPHPSTRTKPPKIY